MKQENLYITRGTGYSKTFTVEGDVTGLSIILRIAKYFGTGPVFEFSGESSYDIETDSSTVTLLLNTEQTMSFDSGTHQYSVFLVDVDAEESILISQGQVVIIPTVQPWQ